MGEFERERERGRDAGHGSEKASRVFSLLSPFTLAGILDSSDYILYRNLGEIYQILKVFPTRSVHIDGFA